MKMADFTSPAPRGMIGICPNCGSAACHDNRIDDRLYVEAAREAPRLRYEGCAQEAVELLTALYAIKIVNFVRPRWRCACGARFDD